MLNAGMVGGLEVLPYTFPSDLFTSGIVFSDPQVQVQRQELLDVTSGLEGGRNPNGMCGPSERTRWRCEHEVRSMLEEAHRENLRVLGGEEMRGVLDDLAARLVRDKEVSGDAVREMIQQQRVGGERW